MNWSYFCNRDTTANLVLVNLYWNIGRVITQDIQNNEKRAGYGKQLLERLAETLVKEYGQGFSLRNLRDMRRFYEYFTIRQALPAEFGNVGKRQALPDELSSTTTPDKPSQNRQAPPAESKGPLPIDFRSHSGFGIYHQTAFKRGLGRAIKDLQPTFKRTIGTGSSHEKSKRSTPSH